MSAFNWKVAALRQLMFYALDMSIAIGGWTWGFGLTVKNWWALLGLLIFSRFITYTVQTAWMRRDAEQFAVSVHARKVTVSEKL